MHNTVLALWGGAVAASFFGWGAALLRILRYPIKSLAVCGSLGVATYLTLGGWLNLSQLISRPVIVALVVTGVILTLLLRLPSQVCKEFGAAKKELTPPAAILLSVAILLLVAMALGALKPLSWNPDDLHAYMVFPAKALQNHSLQTDPFSERRIAGGLGGAFFLDAIMLVPNDFRALEFIDGSFGLLLYALSLWSVGRLWKVPGAVVAIGLLAIPIATLMQVNLTLVYLSAAGFLAILIVSGESQCGGKFSIRGATLIGLVAGGLCTTKTSNLVFLIPFTLVAAGLKVSVERRRIIPSTALCFVIAASVILPWSLAQKRTEGTYLYPLLGKGFHSSAYGLLPAPAAVSSPANTIFIMLPIFLITMGLAVTVWKLTSESPDCGCNPLRAYAVAAAIAVPGVSWGTGGEGADRFTAPFVMPLLLLTAMLLTFPQTSLSLRHFRWFGGVVVALGFFYVAGLLGVHLRWFHQEKRVIYQVANRLPKRDVDFQFRVTPEQLEEERQRDLRVQSKIPLGAKAIEIMQFPYGFDFRRNTVFVCDFCGMAGLPPGMPLNTGYEGLRKYLIENDISYVIFDRRRLGYSASYPWAEFIAHPELRLSPRQLLFHFHLAHTLQPWGRMELSVAFHVGDQMYDLASSSPIVYDDGTVIAARIQ